MKVSNEVNEFIDSLKSKKKDPIVKLIHNDINKFQTDITRKILNREIELEGNWSNYVLKDININFISDPLRASELLIFYGIDKVLPPLDVSDTTLIILYQCNFIDIFDRVADIVNMFHVAVYSDKNTIKINEWIMLYDII